MRRLPFTLMLLWGFRAHACLIGLGQLPRKVGLGAGMPGTTAR